MGKVCGIMMAGIPWYMLVIPLAVGALYAGVLYAIGPRPFRQWLCWLLAALRCSAVAGIVLLMLSPVVRRTTTDQRLPHVVLVADGSQSVRSGCDSAFSWEPVVQALAASCRLTCSTDTSHWGFTDLSALLLAPPDADAIVLASDGLHNRGISPVNTARRLSVPVYTVALGDTTPQRDAALMACRTNRIAIKGSDIPLEFTLNATLLAGRHTSLTVYDPAGHQLASATVTYTDTAFSTTLPMTITASKEGLQRFTATLHPVDGEQNLANNTLEFYVDVVDGRRRVAIVANAPHPDLSAIKRAIESDANYTASIIMADELQKRPSLVADSNFGLLVLHNLPSPRHLDLSFAEGHPRMFIVGLQTDLSRFNALQTGLDIVARTHGVSEVTALRQSSFTLFSLPEATMQSIERFPPLAAPFGDARLGAGMQVLFGARLASIDTRKPLIAASLSGGERCAVVWGEGLWRWRLADYADNATHEHFDQLLARLAAFATLPNGRNRLRVDAARSYAEDERPVLEAQLYNAAYQLTTTPEMHLHLASDSLEADFSFLRTATGYHLQLPTLPAGVYRYKATADSLAAEGIFVVEPFNMEQRHLVADHALLRAVSDATGGRTYLPNQMGDLIQQLASLKPTIYQQVRYDELARRPWVLVILLLLLGGEWVLRKYHGRL